MLDLKIDPRASKAKQLIQDLGPNVQVMAFRLWMDGYRGIPAGDCNCVLANYLKDKLGISVEVTRDIIYIGSPDKRRCVGTIVNSELVKEFIRKFDFTQFGECIDWEGW